MSLRSLTPSSRAALPPGALRAGSGDADRCVLRRRDGLLEIRPARRPPMPAFELLLRAGLIAAPIAVCAAGVLGRGALLFLFAGLATAVALGLRSVAAFETAPEAAGGARSPARPRRSDRG